MTKDASGQYTPQNIHRLGKMAGPMGKEVDRLFAENVSQTFIPTGSNQGFKETKQSDIVEIFVKSYEHDHLVENIRRRQHKKFPKFDDDMSIKSPEKLKEALSRYSVKIDKMTEQQTVYDKENIEDDGIEEQAAHISDSEASEEDLRVNLSDISFSDFEN